VPSGTEPVVGRGGDAGARAARLAVHLVLAVGALAVTAPFVWMVSVSLSPPTDVFAWPPRLVPREFRFANYVEALGRLSFGRYLLNSLVVAGASTASVLVLDSLAGYAFARLRFPGRAVVFVFILGTVMIPIQVTMIPIFVMFRGVPLLGGNDLWGAGGTGLIDTYPALVVPWMATTFGTYLMREFFSMLPGELADAARIDGCGELGIFARVYLPLARPALATVGILTFTEVWNTFLWPLIMTTSPSMRTLQLGLAAYKGQYFTDWHLLMAATVVTCLPVFIVYLVGQRYFVQGIALTGFRG
jgi:multiple sugar transport system permease protein